MSEKHNSGYFFSSMPYDPRREIVWKYLTNYFQRYISENDSVLELGAGYCHFINNVLVNEKYALDIDSKVLQQYAGEGVRKISGNVLEIERLIDRKFDVIFVSHLFEHIPMKELHILLPKLREMLTEGGRLIILQPNYRYAYKEYFDDFTHVTVLDHVSLERLLLFHGFRILKIQKRFLPYSMDSKLPVFDWLVYLYLRSPLKLFGKQMFCVAQKKGSTQNRDQEG